MKKAISTPIAIIIIIVLAGIVIGGVLAYQYYWPTSEEGTEASSMVEISLNDIKNGVYRMTGMTVGQKYKTIQFKDGGYEEDNYGATIEKVALGDLNNNNKKDAAIIISDWRGGTGIFYWLTIIVNQNGKLFHIASAMQNLGDRIRINSVEIQDGLIMVNMLTRTGKIGEAGSAVSPDIKTIIKYKLSGESLLLVEGEEIKY